MTDNLESSQSRSSQEGGWLARMLVMVCLLVLAIGFIASLYTAGDIYIVLFLAVLFSVFLNRLAGFVASYCRIGYGAALTSVILTLALLSVGTTWGIAARMREELEQATGHIDVAKRDLRKTLQDSPEFQSLLDQVPVIRQWIAPVIETPPTTRESSIDSKQASSKHGNDGDQSAGDRNGDRANSRSGERAEQDSGELNSNQSDAANRSEESGEIPQNQFSQAPGAAKSVSGSFFRAVGETIATTFGLGLSILIIIFVGIFLAVAPGQMQDGVVNLAFPKHREELRRVMDCMADSLWRWLVGRFASMVLTGLGIGLSLWLLGVPLPLTLGVLTGLLTFIPNIGAAIALGLAMFFALPTGIATVGWVLVVFLVFQLVESNLLTPMIQQYQVSLPPALLISFQALMGGMLGFLGALIASPVLVIVLVLNHEVYQRRLEQEKGRHRPPEGEE